MNVYARTGKDDQVSRLNQVLLLIVSDNPTFRQIVARFVTLLPEVSVINVLNSRSIRFKQGITSPVPDLVLIDFSFDGIETIAMLRTVYPQTKIIALISSELEINKTQIIGAGAQECLNKLNLDTTLLPLLKKFSEELSESSI